MGVSVADFDNDVWQDIYVTGYGGNVLYRNLGNCKFEDVTDKAGRKVGGFSTSATLGTSSATVMKKPAGFAAFPCSAVRGLPGESDFLFRNKRDGTFEDVSKKAGVDDPKHYFGM